MSAACSCTAQWLCCHLVSLPAWLPALLLACLSVWDAQVRARDGYIQQSPWAEAIWRPRDSSQLVPRLCLDHRSLWVSGVGGCCVCSSCAQQHSKCIWHLHGAIVACSCADPVVYLITPSAGRVVSTWAGASRSGRSNSPQTPSSCEDSSVPEGFLAPM